MLENIIYLRLHADLIDFLHIICGGFLWTSCFLWVIDWKIRVKVRVVTVNNSPKVVVNIVQIEDLIRTSSMVHWLISPWLVYMWSHHRLMWPIRCFERLHSLFFPPIASWFYKWRKISLQTSEWSHNHSSMCDANEAGVPQRVLK